MRAGQEHRVIGQGWGQIQDGIAVVQMAAEVAEAGSGLGGRKVNRREASA